MVEDRYRQARLRKLSKFLSLLLRHRPARFPIRMDAEGYAGLGEILHILHGLPNFRWATRADVEAAIALPGRRRFEIVGDAGDARIRALYGHTAIRPTYPPVAPPDVLYHGTAPETLAAIRREGLKPMERQYVHLAIDPETARDIAIRHTDTPAILCVAAAAAYAAGVRFYHPVEQIYLSDPIPPQYVAL